MLVEKYSSLMRQQRFLIERLRRWQSPSEIVRVSDELHALAVRIAIAGCS